jgi:hypothetical protein
LSAAAVEQEKELRLQAAEQDDRLKAIKQANQAKRDKLQAQLIDDLNRTQQNAHNSIIEAEEKKTESAENSTAVIQQTKLTVQTLYTNAEAKAKAVLDVAREDQTKHCRMPKHRPERKKVNCVTSWIRNGAVTVLQKLSACQKQTRGFCSRVLRTP